MRNQYTLFAAVIIVLLISGCEEESSEIHDDNRRNSAVVTFVHSTPVVQEWLRTPKKSYVQAYVKFPPDLAADVLFGIDQEFLEGVDDFIHFPGADWMALVGVTREGILYYPVGTPESLAGTPTDASFWEYVDLNITLEPDTWYLLREEADFSTLTYVSFTIKGPGVDKTVSLNHALDYPNYVPINARTLTYYSYAIRIGETTEQGSTTVFFDDIKAGIETSSGYTVILQDSFEDYKKILDIPLTLTGIDLDTIDEYNWYKENEDARVSMVKAHARTGSYCLMCDAAFKGLKEANSIYLRYALA